MLFNSLQYAIFLPIVFFLYWLLPVRCRWALLFAASYYFYMSWNAKYVFLILFTTAVSYFAALLLEKAEDTYKRKAVLLAALVLCLGVLIAFKYFNFFFDSLTALFGRFAIQLHPVTLNVVLPVGVSFYTFQTLSYVIDVYCGDVKAEQHFGIYATFISFFPQLVAGPIERTENLLPQIRGGGYQRLRYDDAMYGAKLMVWGYFKKLVIADNLAVFVDAVYDAPSEYQGCALVLATLFFTFQIYCDFSGYSDIAKGSAKLLGINLMTNFKSPYYSASVREFWRRWHISLSTWFRDYVYIPLGGSRRKKLRNAFNLLITFLVSGLWHGANWTFLIWGGVHGAVQIVENTLRLKDGKRHATRALRVCLVFVIVALAWVFFRAQNVSEAFYVYAHMLDGVAKPIQYLHNGLVAVDTAMSTSGLVVVTTSLLTLALYDYFNISGDVIVKLEARKSVLQWTFYLYIGLMIVYFAPKGVAAEFVYFQF